MKKMFSILVLALSLCVNAQNAPVAPSTQKSTVTATVTKPSNVKDTVTTVLAPATTPLADTNKVDTSKSTPVADVKQATPPAPVTNKETGMPWGFLAVIVVIVGLILFVTFKKEEVNEPDNEPQGNEPENATPVNATPVDDSVTEKESKN